MRRDSIRVAHPCSLQLGPKTIAFWLVLVPRHLRAIARKLIEMAEDGDLQAVKEVGGQAGR